ncbi:MAG: hypothetical protein ACI4QI_05615 [Candidatus Coproplasma sp.]
MRKNGSRQISVKQYRLTDLFLFAVILALGELLPYFAMKWFPSQATFTLSFMVPIVAVVMLRWGWPSVIYALMSGLLYCLLTNGEGRHYATYIIGNAFIALMLIPRYLIGVDKIVSRWWATALFVAGAWGCVCLGRATVYSIGLAISPVEGVNAGTAYMAFALYDVVSLIIGALIVIVLRRFDGMVEDQNAFLARLDVERKEKMRRDEFGDELEEIDEESLEILNKQNDLYD